MKSSQTKISILKSSISVIAFCAMAGAASAQDADDNPVATTKDEIIVTGLKRDSSLAEAPVSVQVFTESTIQQAGIDRPADYLNLVPNVTLIDASGVHAGEAFIAIRGQTSIRQSESAVAVVIDGVQLSTQNEFNGELFDIQQIEVLKGPQGAIYGRNASAGAIIIQTKPPTDEFTGNTTLSYGNWDSYKVNAAVSGALIPEKLRFRAAASLNDTEGPFENIVTGENVARSNEKLGRLRLDWIVNDDITADFRIGASRLTGGAIRANPQIAGTVVGGVPVPAVDTGQTNIPFVADVPGENLQTKFNASLKVDVDLGIGTLTSITAWNEISDNYQAKNFPYSNFSDARNDFGVFATIFGDRTQKFRIDNEAFTQEIRLTSPGDQRVRWQLGFYFLDSDRRFTTEQGLNGRPTVNPDGTLVPPVVLNPDGTLTINLSGGGQILPTIGIDGIDTVNPTDSYDDNSFGATNYAPFGNIQIDITDSLELSAAVRYDIEERSIVSLTPDIPNPVTGAPSFNQCVLLGIAAADCRDERTFKQAQPKATLTYKFPDSRGSIFASYGRSFKSGGFNPIGTRQNLIDSGLPPATIFVQDSYDKEVADAYEIGVKTVWADGRVRLNGAAFYTDVENSQQFEFFPSTGAQAVSAIDNVEIFGFEADATIQPTDYLTIFFGGGYIDAEIRELRAAPQFEGNRAPFTYDYNVNAGFQVAKPLDNGLTALARGEYIRTGSVWYDAANLAGTRRDPVDLVNARLGVSGDNWEVSLWSRNLFNERYNADVVPLLSFISVPFKALPRSYGGEVRISF